MKIHDYSIIQIADAVNLSVRTVNRRIDKLKRKIKRAIMLSFFLWHFFDIFMFMTEHNNIGNIFKEQ